MRRRGGGMATALAVAMAISAAIGAGMAPGAAAAQQSAATVQAGAPQTPAAEGAAPSEARMRISVASWPGAFGYAQLKTLHEPFMAAHPEYRVLQRGGSAEVVDRLQRIDGLGGPGWHVANVVAADALRLCDELLAEPIEHDDVLAPGQDGAAPSADFGAFLVSDCFVPQAVFATAMGFRTDAFRKPPNSICALFDVKNFPGKRALPSQPVNLLEWALICDGVEKAKIYDLLETDEGVRRALRKLESVRDQILWSADGEAATGSLTSGEAVMAAGFHGRFFALKHGQSAPVAVLWDAQFLDVDGWIVPTGLAAERRAAVNAFLRFVTEPTRLAALASYVGYGPARRSALALVTRHPELELDMTEAMPNAPQRADKALMTNFAWWAEHRDSLDVKFQAWLSQ